MHHGLRTAATQGLVAGTAGARALASSLARGGALAASTTRGGALAAMAAGTAAGFASAWHSLPPGVVSWDGAADALLESVRLIGPVAAGIAAWTAIADRRTGLRKLERLAVRSAASRPLGRLGAAAATAVVSYLFVAAGLTGWMIANGPVAGPVPAAELLAGAAALLCCVAVGFLVGGLIPATGPPVLSGLAVATGAWALTSLSGPAVPAQLGRSGWWRLLVPPDLHHPLFTEWRPGLFGAEVAWFAGLGFAGMLAFCWSVGRRRRYLGAAVIPLALAVTGAGWIHAERLRPVVPDSPGLQCQTWPLVICVHPALALALPQLESSFTTIAAHVGGTPAALRRLVQYPADVPLPRGRGTGYSYAFHLDNLATGYENGVEASVSAQVIPLCRGVAGQLNDPVRAWLLDTPMPGDVSWFVGGESASPVAVQGSDGIFRAYTEKQRRQWLRRHYRQVVGCKLRPSDFSMARKGHRH